MGQAEKTGLAITSENFDPHAQTLNFTNLKPCYFEFGFGYVIKIIYSFNCIINHDDVYIIVLTKLYWLLKVVQFSMKLNTL